MFHLGDIVEEIATKRQGKIDSMSESRDHTGKVISVNDWRVFLSDGKQPLIQYFKNAHELELVSCPHKDPEPRFVQTRGIMG